MTSGLRERKKAATRLALHEAALRLVAERGVRFRYALLVFDIVTVLFIIATSFLPSSEIIETLGGGPRPDCTIRFTPSHVSSAGQPGQGSPSRP